jgi:hypothetical protein
MRVPKLLTAKWVYKTEPFTADRFAADLITITAVTADPSPPSILAW